MLKQTILIPPLSALLLYLLITYLILPYYRRLRLHSSYTLLPSSFSPPSSDSVSFAQGLFSRVSSLLGRRGSGSGAESLLGDEELEEDFVGLSDSMTGARHDVARTADADSERRLSHELERGFRDSSDEED